ELVDDDYIMKGDVNSDGTVDNSDVRLLQDWLLAKPDATLKNWKAADTCEDDRLDVYDMCRLRSMIINWQTEETVPTEISFVQTKTAQWKLRNGMEEKTLQCTFRGTPGNTINMCYGYWNPVIINESTGTAGKWFNNEDTKLGEYTFDENGEAVIIFTVPADAMNVELITLNHTVMQDGKKVQLDKEGLTLEKVTYNNES
ncbi:MAG: dockerin type I repeat-containing protein, partial [Ruminococcus sp.]|nr:dockerin type I repeat-containing protein [Ruminococcus sp.]